MLPFDALQQGQARNRLDNTSDGQNAVDFLGMVLLQIRDLNSGTFGFVGMYLSSTLACSRGSFVAAGVSAAGWSVHLATDSLSSLQRRARCRQVDRARAAGGN